MGRHNSRIVIRLATAIINLNLVVFQLSKYQFRNFLCALSLCLDESNKFHFHFISIHVYVALNLAKLFLVRYIWSAVKIYAKIHTLLDLCYGFLSPLLC